MTEFNFDLFKLCNKSNKVFLGMLLFKSNANFKVLHTYKLKFRKVKDLRITFKTLISETFKTNL